MFTKAWTVLLLAELALSMRVYLHPSPESVSPTSVLSPKQARVVVSHHLGLDVFESWDDIDSSIESLLPGTPFLGQGPRNAMILTVSEDIAKDVVPPLLKPTFSLADPPSAAAEISSTVNAYLLRAEHVYTTVLSSAASSPAPSLPRLIDLFSASESSATETFLSETAQVVAFVESDDESAFGAFELTGLSAIAAEYGRDSEQFRLAAETTKALLASAITSQKLNFALLTYPGSSAKRQTQPPQQSPLPPPAPPPQLPIGGVSTCHATLDACTNATDTCSGRGACAEASKAGKSCFVCACNVTVDDKGRREWWVGDACERKDVSGPFTLITGTVVVILLLIVGSVSLLYNVGDQTLPPTLTASASGGSLKRD